MTDKRAKAIGARIKELRLKAGLSQLGLASKAGIQSNTVARAERGLHRPSLETLEKLAKVLSVTTTDITGV